jgi:hypothetical protein
MKTYTNTQLLLRILMEGFIWGLGFLAAIAFVGLLLNIWESPAELLTFLGSGRSN